LPQNAENYIHRIGRTARAGKTGKAISLACEECVFHLEPIEELLGYKIPVVWPQEDWFGKDKAGKVHFEPKERHVRERRQRPPKEEKPAPAAGRWKTVAFSSQPGGVFGLAVQPDTGEPERPAEGEPKKKRKRKWGRGKKKSGAAPAPSEDRAVHEPS
jgi:ATP-dependent RNA helicase RhlB